MPAIDPITVPVTMVVTNAAPLRAVTDALTDLATAIRNMLDDQAEPIPSDEALADMARRAYDGRYSKLCAHECADGTCADPGKIPQCGGCCDCLGGCNLGYEEQRAEAEKAAANPTDPESTIEPKPDAPIDLDSLGLGAVVRAGIGEDPRVLWVRMPDGGLWCSDARGIRCIDAYWLRGTVSSDLTDVEVLHPGITIGGEGV